MSSLPWGVLTPTWLRRHPQLSLALSMGVFYFISLVKQRVGCSGGGGRLRLSETVLRFHVATLGGTRSGVTEAAAR